MAKKIFLIDGFALIYRAFFAFGTRPLITPEGQNVSALYGFFNSLFALLDRENPEYMAIVLDTSAPTFRHRMYKEYKATRQKMPDDLRSQLPILFDIIKATNIKTVSLDGFEADDLIGTLSVKAKEEDFDTYIYSSDKDLAQLVNDRVFLYEPKTNEVFDREAVKEKFGLFPEQIADYLALMGDTSDNVPGVPKVGKKTAVALLQEWTSLDRLYENIEFLTKKAVKKSLIENRELADLSKRLVLIDKEIEIDIALEEFQLRTFDYASLIGYFNKYNMTRLTKYVSDKAGKSVEIANAIKSYSSDQKKYITIKNFSELKELVKTLNGQKALAFYVECTAGHYFDSRIVGLSFSFKNDTAYFIPSSFERTAGESNGQMDLFGGSVTFDSDIEKILEILKPVLTGGKIDLYGYDLKRSLSILSNYGIKNIPVAFDLLLADYLLRSARSTHPLENIALNFLDYAVKEEKELLGSGRNKIRIEEVEISLLAIYASEKADVIYQLTNKLSEELKKDDKLNKLFYDIEIPLLTVLKKMELKGVRVNNEELLMMSKEIGLFLEKQSEKIQELAGCRFNVDSPKQLSEVLFEKMKLLHGKKGKSGVYSTDSKVLEKLKNSGEEIAAAVLEYREKSKLKNTYVDGLIKSINSKTARIHTTYNQAVATTGRLSSSEPNLQSIPIKTKSGEKIRQSFIASEGYKILAADYSQIELRILAHYCKDENLMKAFREGIDIHSLTASILFGADIENVTKIERSKAKTANFAVLYGKSKFGLSEDMGISFAEASVFIEDYFNKFSKIKSYIEEMEEVIKKSGSVETLFGRKRRIDEIRSENRNVVNSALRQAVNAPIQGTAADIIKMAMIAISKGMDKFDGVMMLQVHDELVFEIKESQVSEFSAFVKDVMENIVKLDVPLEVNIGIGDNWLQAH